MIEEITKRSNWPLSDRVSVQFEIVATFSENQEPDIAIANAVKGLEEMVIAALQRSLIDGKSDRIAWYARQNQRTQAWLSRAAQKRAGLEPIPNRLITDALLAGLLPEDIEQTETVE